jgi:predicted carbohydrate-binding protein with CBM5 and CBM33 domain
MQARKEKNARMGRNTEALLSQVKYSGMLPTPAARDYKGARSKKALKKAGRNETNSLPDSFRAFQTWQKFPTQSPICGGDDGLPTELDGITFPKWRNESIKAYGNAIVPQVAYEIFKAINEMDKSLAI